MSETARINHIKTSKSLILMAWVGGIVAFALDLNSSDWRIDPTLPELIIGLVILLWLFAFLFLMRANRLLADSRLNFYLLLIAWISLPIAYVSMISLVSVFEGIRGANRL